MATALEPMADSEEDLLIDLRPKSPYGEPLGKFHVATEWPQPLPRSRHARRPRADARYRTQPVTFDEIREVDEDVSQVSRPAQETGQRTADAAADETDHHRQRITELKCPIKLEALNAAIEKIMKKPAASGADEDDIDKLTHIHETSDPAETV
ncbi:uncharacterized protein LOC110983436 [Acanthaster planci]|uniref:Uncharacterized protein LOC110983436 n=1 Tax=Acanthaster planci TaxID=133434 RepID=A0A8B7Z0A0_ACAPL|nr:uncharacterized protein LOC110983436 [Acanthaster planci]XP_022098387.1 uncharacterized protein LOC110983436 [Acanthaster planci]